MDDTYALLSNLVQTKSIQRVLAPIASQVSQLIIQNEAYEADDKDAFPADLIPSATSVMKSTEGLVDAARRLAADSVDEELKTQMPKACDLLSIAGQGLVTASQRVHMENFSSGCRRHLIRMAKDVLEGTLKVLLVSDDAEVRKIVRSANWVKDRLAVLTAVKTMKHLVPCFKAFTEALMLLTNLADKRQIELVKAKQREHVISSMATLKKCVPMLSSAMQTYVKYNDSEQTSQSKEYVIGQILQCLEEITMALENKMIPGDEDLEPEEPGHFITTIDKVIERLSGDSRPEMALVGSEFDMVAETAIRHSMAVAHVSAETHRNLIIKNCQRVLRQRTHLSELTKSVAENPGYQELRADFDDECERLVEEFQDLERHVNAAVLQLIVNVFKETTEPMERLVKAAMGPAVGCEELSESESQAMLVPYIEAFHDHSDSMCQVARFAAASSSDSKRVRIIRACASHLENLDPELVPATISCRRVPSNKGAVEHLRLLKKEWTANIQAMVQNIDLLTDAKLFIQVSEVEMRGDLSQTRNSMYLDAPEISNCTRSLIGHARRAAQTASRLVDTNHDPMFRNGVMVYVSQLNKALLSVKSAANRLVGSTGELRYHETLHKRCDITVKCVSKLNQIIHGKLLPDLLDPARENVRPSEGVKALGLNIDYDEESDNDEDKENIAATENLKKKAATKAEIETVIKKKVAMKKYISDIVNSRILELSQAVVSASVAGQQKKLDLLCNQVLVSANHVTELANDIAACISNGTQKETLLTLSSSITELTPQILDKSTKVVDCDTYQVDALHDTADDWANQVSYLQSYIDGLIDKWKRVSDKVVDAAKMGNVRLLAVQTQLIKEHGQAVGNLSTVARDLVTPGEASVTERAQLILGHADQFENSTTLLATMADLTANSGKDDEKIQLEMTGRDWAAKVFCITCLIATLAQNAVEKLTGRSQTALLEDVTQVNQELRDITKETIRLKAQATSASSGCGDEDKKEKVTSLMAQLDALLSHMDDCVKLCHQVTAPYQSTDKLYAPQKMCLLQWEWAQIADQLTKLVDDITAEYSQAVIQILTNAETLAATSEGLEEDAQKIQFRRANDQFREGFMKSRARVLDAIQTSSDFDMKSDVRKHLEDLGTLAQEIESASQKVADSGEEDAVKAFRELQRSWAIRMSQMMGILHNLKDANKAAVREAIEMMKPSAPSVTCTSSTMRETGKRFVQFIEPSPGGAKPRPTTPGRTPSSLAKFREQESLQLTGSLLDFAVDLCDSNIDNEDTRDETTAGTLKVPSDPEESNVSILDIRSSNPSKTVHFHHHQQREMIDVAATMWFDEELPSDSDGSNTTTPKPVDKSWKVLSQGPKVQHTAPVRSDRKPLNLPSKRVSHVLAPYMKVAEEWLRGAGLPFEEKWEDDNNAIVKGAKDISKKMRDMKEFTKGIGPIETKEELYQTAKEIAKRAETLVKFAKVIVEHCVDEKIAANLKSSSEHVPTIIAQLQILSMVKEATPEDNTNEKMLIRTAENLVDGLNRMLRDSESACVKGLHQHSGDKIDETQAVVLAAQWKRKFDRHRIVETSNATTDNLGLRKVNHNNTPPHLTQIMLQR